MERNEKGQFVSDKATAEVDYVAEIEAAEKKVAELKKAQADKLAAEKEEKALAKKAEALPVQNAIDAYEAAKATCNDIIKEAYEEYQAKVVEAEKVLNKAQAEADEKLNDFLKNHPEGFHYTFRSADGKVTREYNYYRHRYDVFDDFKRLSQIFSNMWTF